MNEQKINEIPARDAASNARDIENVELEELYYCGVYQVMVFIAFTLACFAFAINLTFMSYSAWEPPWTCYVDRENVGFSNSTVDKCSAFENSGCTNISWSHVLFNSIVPEWNLLCNERKKVYLSISVQMAGHLLGVPLVTQISDLFGRKVALLTITAGHAIAGIGSSFCTKWKTFAACRFVAGFFAAGYVSISSVYLLESVSPRKRMLLMSIGGVNTGFLLTTGVAPLLRNWRSMCLCSGCTGAITLAIIAWLNETPRWLVQRGKTSEARRVYLRVLRLNWKSEKQLSDAQWERLVERVKAGKTKRRSFWHLFSDWEISRKTIVACQSMLSMTLTSTLLLYSVDDLSGNLYENYAIFASVRWVGCALGMMADRFIPSLGRKLLMGTLLSIVTCCLLALTVIEWLGGVNTGFLLTTGVAPLLRNWRSMCLCSGCTGAITLAIIAWLNETPRWLVQRGKTSEARRVYLRVLRLNWKSEKQLSDAQWERLVERVKAGKTKRRSFWHLFSDWEISRKTIVACQSMLSMTLTSTLLLYSVDDLSGNLYENYAIFASVRWVGCALGMMADRFIPSLGRKLLMGTLLSIVTCCLLALTVIEWLECEIPHLKNVLLFFGAAVFSPVWIVLLLVVMELYPTSMRSIATGFTGIFGGVGSIIMPQLLLLGRIWKPGTWLVLTIVCSCFLASFTAFIPETKGKPLIDDYVRKQKVPQPVDNKPSGQTP